MPVNPAQGNLTPTQAVVVVNPDGSALGSPSSPLTTQTTTLQTTPDLTTVLTTISTATTTSIVAAAASTRTRVYRMRVDVAAADVLTFNAQVTDVQTYTAGGFRIYDFSTRPWFTTAVNTAFTVTTTTTAVVNIVTEYTRVA